jgi:S1-C subfamily serine protease
MRCSRLYGVVLLLLVAAATASAQPVLEQVEKDVRRQVGGRAPLPGPTAPGPTVPGLTGPGPAVPSPRVPGATEGVGSPAFPAQDAGVAEPAGAQPGYLGVVADDRNENGRGVRIREVTGAPAGKAGLLAGDLITAIQGRPVRSLDDMAKALQPVTVGQKVDFQIDRAGAIQVISVVLGTRPPKTERRFPEFGKVPEEVGPPADRLMPQPITAAPSGPLLGVRSIPLPPELRRQFKVGAEVAGALVSAVTVGSAADAAGITPGMLITAVNGHDVDGPDALIALVRQAGAGRDVELTFWDQDGQQHRRVVTLSGGNAGAPRGVTQPRPTENDPIMLDPPLAQPTREPVPPSRDPAQPPRVAPSIEQLQQRIRQLELRIEKLEAAQARRSGG